MNAPEQTASVSPLILCQSKDVDDFSLDKSAKQYSAGLGRRLSGRPSYDDSWPSPGASPALEPQQSTASLNSNSNEEVHRIEDVLSQIGDWIDAEKSKRKFSSANLAGLRSFDLKKSTDEGNEKLPRRARGISGSSESSLALEKLEQILWEGMKLRGMQSQDARSKSLRSQQGSIRRNSIKKKSRSLIPAASSDTEYRDGDVKVPNCDVILDNSCTTCSVRIYLLQSSQFKTSKLILIAESGRLGYFQIRDCAIGAHSTSQALASGAA